MASRLVQVCRMDRRPGTTRSCRICPRPGGIVEASTVAGASQYGIQETPPPSDASPASEGRLREARRRKATLRR
jgi:hypothetical protein